MLQLEEGCFLSFLMKLNIKIAGRNNNLRYADGTTLMTESERN